MQLDAAKTYTFKDCAKRYIAAHQPAGAQRQACGAMGLDFRDLRLSGTRRSGRARSRCRAVLKAIEPIWTAKPETASRVRGRIESIIDWATARGYRQGENPARWRGHLETCCRRPPRCGASSTMRRCPIPRSVPSWLSCAREQEGIAARALEFAILTAARTGEVIGARWDGSTWASD